jgi:hypothetical protein
MADDVLSRVKSNQINQERIQIGDYLFRPPDFRQIMRWAKGLGLDPLDLLSIFQETKRKASDYSEISSAEFEVVDGSIRSLVWDFCLLPCLPTEWEHGLNIRSMTFLGDSPGSLDLSGEHLSKLEELVCSDCDLSSLRLKKLSSLRLLDCSRNKLVKLDLQDANQLEVLICSSNQFAHFTHIGLQDNYSLRKLACSDNNLNAIDLSFAPSLLSFCVSGNQITEIDLSPVPQLISLICERNLLTRLDASPVPSLIELRCGQNYLECIDITSNAVLECLSCEWNRLHELRLDRNPFLSELRCDGNPLLDIATSAEQQSSCDWHSNIQYALGASFAFYSGSTHEDDEEDDLEGEDDEVIAEYLASRYSCEQLVLALYSMANDPQGDEKRWPAYAKYTEEQLVMALYLLEGERHEGGDSR